MKNTYFSIDATLEQLLGRLQEYARTSLPPEYERLRLAADSPAPLWPEDGLTWLGTFYAVCTVEDDVPFFDMGVQQVDGVCRVRIRCRDPRAASWVRDMIRWLAPGRASGAVQPLPELPTRFSATEQRSAVACETVAPVLPSGSRDSSAQPTESPQVPGPSVAAVRSEGSNRGRPSFPDWYKKNEVEEYHKLRGMKTQKRFCVGKPYKPRTLRSWEVWYKRQFGQG